jgi:pSer/pThr/pTyr-binding forkhead associated (FHA) protein
MLFPAMTRAILVIAAGPSTGRHELEEGDVLVLGRENADLFLDDPQVSRRHAVVRVVEGGLEVEDLGSSNGTFVNGRRIERPTSVGASDSLRVGETTIELQVEEPRRAETRISTAPDRGETRISAPVEEEQAPPALHVAAPKLDTFAVEQPKRRRRRGIASRQLFPEILSLTAVGATAVALVLYFGLR